MIIRSQDKKIITNFQQLTDVGIIKIDSVFAAQAYYPFSVDNDFSKMNLGFYSTEEKAIKVLDMIFQEFCDYGTSGAFNMPSDEEVEV